MERNEHEGGQKQRNFGTKVSLVIGASVWWFISGQPSPVSLMLAAILIFGLFLGFCLLAVVLPGPEEKKKYEAFTPIPQSETDRPKALPR
jgi:hypothetical protein